MCLLWGKRDEADGSDCWDCPDQGSVTGGAAVLWLRIWWDDTERKATLVFLRKNMTIHLRKELAGQDMLGATRGRVNCGKLQGDRDIFNIRDGEEYEMRGYEMND